MVGIGEKIIVVRPFCTRFGLTGYVRMIDDDFIYIDYDQESIKIIKELDGNTNPIEFVNNKAPMIPIRLLSSKKINDLGWKPKRNLKEALKETIEWYKANKHLYNPNSKP